MRRRGETLWQSYADLAMGLMAVFILVLVLLLFQQKQLTEDAEKAQNEAKAAEAQARLEREKTQKALKDLEAERGEFAIELVELFEETHDLVLAQDRAEGWLADLFEEGDCRLRMSDKGELVVASPGGGTEAATLYESGKFALSAEGRAALLTCRDNFMKLAHCLIPEENTPPEVKARRLEYCGSQAESTAMAPVSVLRAGVEALTLEGNTDQIPLSGLPSGTTIGDNAAFLAPSFVQNAQLGAERARQALAALIGMVAASNADEWDALQIIMSRVRIESPSYGRYQAGPHEWREPGCDKPGDCAAARNLSLRIRWQKRALRRPFELVRQRVCALLAAPTSAFSKGLVSQGRSVETERQRFGCDEVAP